MAKMAKMEKANAKMHILSHKLAVTLCGIWGRVKSKEGADGEHILCKVRRQKRVQQAL